MTRPEKTRLKQRAARQERRPGKGYGACFGCPLGSSRLAWGSRDAACTERAGRVTGPKNQEKRTGSAGRWGSPAEPGTVKKRFFPESGLLGSSVALPWRQAPKIHGRSIHLDRVGRHPGAGTPGTAWVNAADYRPLGCTSHARAVRGIAEKSDRAPNVFGSSGLHLSARCGKATLVWLASGQHCNGYNTLHRPIGLPGSDGPPSITSGWRISGFNREKASRGTQLFCRSRWLWAPATYTQSRSPLTRRGACVMLRIAERAPAWPERI